MVSYDAIVIGSGISGGWAAKELCERGLKTLVLERGRDVKHVVDYKTAFKHPWEFEDRLRTPNKDKQKDPVQSTSYTSGNKHFYVSDSEHPYIQEDPFRWIRGYQVGGRSLIWGRQCYRMSDLDFEANLKDGVGVDWPIRYKDLAPWYDYVEKFVGISGKKEGLSHLPDGSFLPPMEMNCIEKHFNAQLKEKFGDRIATIGRTANLTKPLSGRSPCQYRNLCSRGCPYGAYFSSNSSTLPAAFRTGNLTLMSDKIVIEVLYDKEHAKATGVMVIDSKTKTVEEFNARIIFINASTIATAALLLNSKSDVFPKGLGNSSGQVGHNLMDHFIGAGARGIHLGFSDTYYYGRRPAGIYVPRFRNIDDNSKRQDYIRGFSFNGRGERLNWQDNLKSNQGFGADFKDKLTKPGPWSIWITAMGETLPNYYNRVELHPTKKDQWGIPLVKIYFKYGKNESIMREDAKNSAEEMLTKSGFKDIEILDYKKPGGSVVHEMGTVRMGKDPATSVLNAHNQMHDVKNVFITDGSSMTSSGCQNPSLTYMALTARACQYAADHLKKGDL
ncbi:MAG: GMC family oxidoreductase [Bacteroidota bacterium]